MAEEAQTETDDQGLRAQQRLGEVLAGKWELRRVLGVGGMAAVYEAEHRNQSRVAIKMLHPEFARDVNVTRRFRQEGYAGNSIQHPGVLRVLDDGTAEDGSVFLVMDLLLGNSLEDILVRTPRLEPVLVAQMADEVLDILEAAHGRGVIHRDIKPDNIFITSSGEIKLLDFGIASVRQSSKATTMGSFMGTPAFCPPEQARGRWSEVDQRSDLWALGATMFTALTGHAVHEGETITEVLALAVQSRAPKLRDLAPDADRDLAKVVDRALEYEKEARFANATAFRDALEALEARLPPSTCTLAELVDLEALSETSGTLLRRRKRAFQTPDPHRSRPREGTQVGLGPIPAVRPQTTAVSPRAPTAIDVRTTGAPTSVSERVPRRRKSWLRLGLAAALATVALGTFWALRTTSRGGATPEDAQVAERATEPNGTPVHPTAPHSAAATTPAESPDPAAAHLTGDAASESGSHQDDSALTVPEPQDAALVHAAQGSTSPRKNGTPAAQKLPASAAASQAPASPQPAPSPVKFPTRIASPASTAAPNLESDAPPPSAPKTAPGQTSAPASAPAGDGVPKREDALRRRF